MRQRSIFLNVWPIPENLPAKYFSKKEQCNVMGFNNPKLCIKNLEVSYSV